MKIFKITILVLVLAMLGGTFNVEAKSKKRRNKARKEKTVKNKKTVKAKEERCILDMVEYQHQGMRMQPVAEVRLERKNGKVVFAVRGTNTEEKEFFPADGEQLLKEALKIIEEEKMLDYGVSYEPEIQPLDGYAWSFSARLSDGRSVSSHGHNAGPDGKGLSRMSELLFRRAYKLLGID
ncbi:MAG: hypothetical protein IKW83_09405 [Muribaculaceae bacterium]|nr:hypothetical protein [Muribaculaceae bacterium]